jgi:hypothetical protein
LSCFLYKTEIDEIYQHYADAIARLFLAPDMVSLIFLSPLHLLSRKNGGNSSGKTPSAAAEGVFPKIIFRWP